jgi:serine/threonine-protein kinase RsbW
MVDFHESIKFPAQIENLYNILHFIKRCAHDQGLPKERIKEIELAAEEALVNIFNYAYPGEKGDVEVHCRVDDPGTLICDIIDAGIPFNILSQADPDLSGNILERDIGGLGVFLIKKMADSVDYERKEDRNILTLTFHKT